MKNERDSGLLFPARPSVGRNLLWIAGIALIYFAAARLSLLLQFQPQANATGWLALASAGAQGKAAV